MQGRAKPARTRRMAIGGRGCVIRCPDLARPGRRGRIGAFAYWGMSAAAGLEPGRDIVNCRALAGRNTFRPPISVHDPPPVLLDLPVHRIGREVQATRPGDCA
jgi:hypothetical protein